jgi:hypothetical protein
MPAAEKADKQLFEHVFLPDDDLFELAPDPLVSGAKVFHCGQFAFA